jgi:hypothetical protein
MKLQVKPEPWLCMATSFAMAVDVPVRELIARMGHDGSKIVFPEYPDPQCRAGHHIQECINAALRLGFATTPVELFPVSAANNSENGATHQVIYSGGQLENWIQFIGQIQRSRGVVTGRGRSCGHAMAYENGVIFDPDGVQFDYSKQDCERRGFITRCVWRVDPIARTTT